MFQWVKGLEKMILYPIFASVNIILYDGESRHALHDAISLSGASVATMSLSRVTVRVSLCVKAIGILAIVVKSAIVFDVS